MSQNETQTVAVAVCELFWAEQPQRSATNSVQYGWHTSSWTAQWVSGGTTSFAIRNICIVSRVAHDYNGPTVRGVCHAWSISPTGQDLVTRTVRWGAISGERYFTAVRIRDGWSGFRAPEYDGPALSLCRLCHVYSRYIAITCFSCCTFRTEASVPAASKRPQLRCLQGAQGEV